jgi:hypothetical protein
MSKREVLLDMHKYKTERGRKYYGKAALDKQFE